MTTTFSAISLFLRSRPAAARAARGAIIGAAVLVLAGCSALRLGYNNAPQLLWWWSDGYAGFSREQAPAVREAFDSYFDWHRSTQLPVLAQWLGSLEPALAREVDAQTTCGWFEQSRRVLAPSVERALEQVADLLPSLTEANLRSLEERNARNMADTRREIERASAAQRGKRALKRSRENFERLYGRLQPAQLQVLQAALAESPFDRERWLAERERRQADTVQTLRRLMQEKAERPARLAALRALAERSQTAADPDHRAYQQQLTQHNCALVAALHNSTTPEQRARAQRQLQGWQGDLLALAAAAGPRAVTAGAR